MHLVERCNAIRWKPSQKTTLGYRLYWSACAKLSGVHMQNIKPRFIFCILDRGQKWNNSFKKIRGRPSLVLPSTAKTRYRKFETNIPRKGIDRPHSQFPHSCVCERFIYSLNRSAYSTVDRSWEYINRSQTQECENWDWGRAIPFLEIHKWDFRCSEGHSIQRGEWVV